MEKTKNAVKYIIDVWDEVTGKTWREKPDHVQQKFLEAENELLNIANVSNRFDPKYTPPFRVGRKQGKAVLDANGREVIFFKDSEEQAKKYCHYLNGC